VHIDLREFRAAYLAEADEHLASANARLVEIDAAIRSGRQAPRDVRDLLRGLHTIKGLSAMVGVEPIVTLTHRMENALRGGLTVASMEPLFAAMRAIEVRLSALAKDEPVAEPPAALLAALAALEGESPAPAEVLELDPAIGEKLGASEREQIAHGVRDGRRLVRVDFAPTPARASTGLGINVVRERLERIGEIVKVVPVSGGPGLVFAILVLTSAEDDAIASSVGIDASDIHPLSTTAPPPAPASGDMASLLDDRDPNDDAPADVSRAVIRVEVARIDDAIEKLSGLVVTRSRLQREIDALAATGVVVRELDAIAAENGRQLKDLRASLLRLRMIPIASMFERLPFVVRGLA